MVAWFALLSRRHRRSGPMDEVVANQGVVRLPAAPHPHLHLGPSPLARSVRVATSPSCARIRQQAAVVMVLSTPEAEAICQKSGMSVTDLFRPYNSFNDLSRTLQSQSPSNMCARLTTFRLRVQ